jgi:2'-5' RNA ligase
MAAMTEAAAQQRLFFALWPAPDVQQALAARAEEALGHRRARRIPAEKLHITLAFLGEVSAETRACAEAAADSLQGTAFDLAIDELGYWSRRSLLWAGFSDTPPALSRLVTDLAAGLEPCGIPPDDRPFRPHITLARKAPRLPPRRAVEPVTWPVRRFVLVESRLEPQGAVYSVVREWPLAD